MKNYPFPKKLTCAEIHSKKSSIKIYKQLTYIKIAKKNKKLPFKNKRFDVLFSNAVLEHVSSAGEQKKIIQESIRIAKKSSLFFQTSFSQLSIIFLTYFATVTKKIFQKILVCINMVFGTVNSI